MAHKGIISEMFSSENRISWESGHADVILGEPATTENANPQGCNQHTGPGCSTLSDKSKMLLKDTRLRLAAFNVKASKEEHAASHKLADQKVKDAPAPSKEAVAKALAEVADIKKRIKAGETNLRPGGHAGGGSSADRRKQRLNLFKEWGGEAKGYIVCPWTGIKMHWTDDPHENPHGYPKFERGKIFTKCQGGGYQLHNLIPESFTANRSRNDTRLRKENSSGC